MISTDGEIRVEMKLLLCFNFEWENTIARMARKPPVKKTDHRKNVKKNNLLEGNQSLKKDDDTFNSTEPSTVNEDNIEEEKEGKTEEKKDDMSAGNNDNKTPTNMIVEVPKKKDGETDMSSLATGTKKTRVATNGKLTIIQKSKLMNWAEEQFLRANKIMTFEEATKDVKLHKAASKAMELEDGDWAIVGAEAIKKLRSAMSDRLCLHRKMVKGLYMGK
jgi:hypothetical protein